MFQAKLIGIAQLIGQVIDLPKHVLRIELIEAIKGKEGVNGIHLMAVGWEEITPRIVTEAGLLPPDFVPPVETEEAQAAA